MDRIKQYSQNFDTVMSARLKGDTVVEALAIIGISIYLSTYLEKTNSNIRNIVNSKPMIALSIAGCLTIANHRPMLSLMIAIAYLAVLSATNKKAEAEAFGPFVPSRKPDFVHTYQTKVDLTNSQLATLGNTKGTLSSLYPAPEPVDYIELSGNKPWKQDVSNLSPLRPSHDDEYQ